MPNKHILVTGIPRCGSTFTGKVMSLSSQLLYIQEPFNPDFGLVGADEHFPSVDIHNPHDKYAILLNEFFSFKARYKKNYSNDNFARKIAKSIFGTRAQKNYRKAGRFHGSNTKFLIKDPDAAMLSEQMYLEHDCNVLILVRHPGAVFASNVRIGRTFKILDFIEKDFFNINRMPIHNKLLKKKNKSLAEEVGLLWIYVYKILNDYSKKYSSWLTMLHEEISLDPIESFKKIFNWADIELTEQIKKEIITFTNSENPVSARDNKMHDLSRNSAGLADYWKKTVSDEDIEVLKEITQSISSLYYDNNSWLK